MFSNFWATRLARYVSAILLSITLLCQPGAREVAGEVLVRAVPAAHASGEPTVSWAIRCGLIMADIGWLGIQIGLAETDLLRCDLAPWGDECSDEERAAIEALLVSYQQTYDRLWARATAMHCVD